MSAPGGGYDTYSRLFARHLGKHIPGKPNVIVINIPGGSGLIGTNYVYNITKRDGPSPSCTLPGPWRRRSS